MLQILGLSAINFDDLFYKNMCQWVFLSVIMYDWIQDYIIYVFKKSIKDIINYLFCQVICGEPRLLGEKLKNAMLNPPLPSNCDYNCSKLELMSLTPAEHLPSKG